MKTLLQGHGENSLGFKFPLIQGEFHFSLGILKNLIFKILSEFLTFNFKNFHASIELIKVRLSILTIPVLKIREIF